MNIFLLATLISIVLYWLGRISITVYVSKLKIDLSKPGTVVTGIIPNLLAIIMMIGYLGMYINGTIYIAYTISQFL